MANLTNDNAIESATPTALWGTITHASLHKSATGDTTYLGSTPLGSNLVPAIGQAIEFAAGEIDIDLNDKSVGGEFGAYGAQQALEGWKVASSSAAFQVGLHTGAPGTNGTANEVSGNGYSRIAEAAADWTVS